MNPKTDTSIAAQDAGMEWDHLRTFERVARLGSLTRASRALGVSQSTVSRHLGRLEDIAGSPLLLRTTPVCLTERGESLLAALLPMVDASLAARAALDDTPELRGVVTVTTVAEVTRWLLITALPSFCADYPKLRLRILMDNQNLSLAAGEADLALRYSRPERGELIARRLRREHYGFFAGTALPLDHVVPWLSLAGSLSHIPEQQFADRAFCSRPPGLMVEDVESLALAVQAGLGVAVLPRALAIRLGGMVEVSPLQIGAEDLLEIPVRDLWLVVHRSKQKLPKVRAVREWLLCVLAAEG